MRPWLLCLVLACCSDATAPPDPWARRSLAPEANPFGPADPLWAPQPHRDRPHAAALSGDGRRLYVALTGTEDVPSEVVAVVELSTRKLLRRIQVGRAPVALALHPGGRYLAVANLYSNWVSVIDTTTDRVVAEPPAPWYTTALAFSPDGSQAYLANRWKDSLLGWAVQVDGGGFHATPDYLALAPDQAMGAPVGVNPDQVVVAPDGRVYVSSIAGGVIDAFQPDGRTTLGRLAVHSPIGGMLLAGPWLVASHIGRGTGFPPAEGVDGDQDGRPGDGTGNIMFQDLQNELEVFDTRTLASQARFTSDTLCCRDYRDVDPDAPMRGLAIPAPETWPPERAAALPPRATWIVAGALPTRMARLAAPAAGVTRLLCIMAASNQAQRLDLDEATGQLRPVDTADHLYATGHAPVDVVVGADGQAFVVDRLGETISVLDTAHAPGGAPVRIVVGDVTRGAFPASDAELGELFNNVTAPLTVDGDQSCVHCHREGGNLDRVVAMPLQANRMWGSRQVQSYRGAFDTRPWFLEAAMDEKNFFPVLNEFDRKENFCCEELDAAVWSKYPTLTACLAAPTSPGCDQVLHCQDTPPPECAARPYGSSYPTRDAFLLAAVAKLTGRTTSFGDALVVAGTRQPLALDFDGVTRALGLFLLAAPRLPPNPNHALATTAAARGERIYRRAEVGCQLCHPLPLTTLAIEPDFSPFGMPVRLPPVITPTLTPDGVPADLVTQGFRDTFVAGNLGGAVQGPEGLHLGVPQLRGLWDRAPRFFHDGRAHSLREALLTPGHAALGPGEQGFNERGGVLDTHGGTSQLTADELDDLMAFVLTL